MQSLLSLMHLQLCYLSLAAKDVILQDKNAINCTVMITGKWLQVGIKNYLISQNSVTLLG